MPTKTTKAKPAARKTAARKMAKRAAPRAKPLKDPAGGLTAAGRKHFEQTEGAHLRPGVTSEADTPEKKVRKGSFLRRHFANPRGPMADDKGEPTRLALSAHAWGEPVPRTKTDAKKLAAKGTTLLDEYHAAKGDKPKRTPARKPAAKRRTPKAK